MVRLHGVDSCLIHHPGPHLPFVYVINVVLFLLGPDASYSDLYPQQAKDVDEGL